MSPHAARRIRHLSEDSDSTEDQDLFQNSAQTTSKAYETSLSESQLCPVPVSSNSDLPQVFQKVTGWYCSCYIGSRTVGTCSHVASVVWYLGFGRYQPPKVVKRWTSFFQDVPRKAKGPKNHKKPQKSTLTKKSKEKRAHSDRNSPSDISLNHSDTSDSVQNQSEPVQTNRKARKRHPRQVLHQSNDSQSSEDLVRPRQTVDATFRQPSRTQFSRRSTSTAGAESSTDPTSTSEPFWTLSSQRTRQSKRALPVQTQKRAFPDVIIDVEAAEIPSIRKKR